MLVNTSWPIPIPTLGALYCVIAVANSQPGLGLGIFAATSKAACTSASD